jgi:hypothetical protein
MPTIHAEGWPTSAHESTAARRSGATHSAAASVPAVVKTAIPAPTGTCAAASSVKLGAAALPTEPSASSAEPPNSWRPMPTRLPMRPSASAVMPATRPATVRSCPAVAVETSRSRATSARTGEMAIAPACEANRHRNRTALTDLYPPFVRVVVVPAMRCRRPRDGKGRVEPGTTPR